MFGTRKLGKTSEQRRAMLRQLTTDLLEHGKLETTFTRAKEVQPVVEKMITLGKKGGLANYRRAMSFITKEDVANKLFKEIAPGYAERNGGYTRVTRVGVRRGDAAETALIELV
ncbi:MAG: 50S ribosomal protein L17 [Oscillospiraceae bacterium]|jgi:large subunit ribosomal protein L17|nr:50S ribosomal protein L17 [Oscillospiraceae bacterium]MEE3458911.1 50S ribosomal protein L17 [Candidatus Faecousia sp.]MBQ1756207.1 50S ribosomal protein L17 [Oscillospiraceae bacterium]MBQ2202818.1 50S ribosomal protein L17 [Oscillospiraceae bacterium]MBQ2328114.1 50S ribosomal protein L17 [Oscillospiraceae bacterium]